MKFNILLDQPLFDDGDSEEPITLEDAKNWLRVSSDITDDDDLISTLITAARQMCEHYTKISFIPRTVTARLQNESNDIELPYGPVTEFISLADADGNAVDAANYTIRGLLFKKLDYCSCDITAVYDAGYGSDDLPLPAEFKSAILNQLAWLYENRGDVNITTSFIQNGAMSPEAILKLYMHRRVR